MKPRFQLEDDSSTNDLASNLVDPEAYDASEQHFAASLERQPRFVVDQEKTAESEPLTLDHELPQPLITQAGTAQDNPSLGAEKGNPQTPTPPPNVDPDAWRQEIAAKVNHYRARKPRPPRYPSLQLKFESPDHVWRVSPKNSASNLAVDSSMIAEPASTPPVDPEPSMVPEGGGKILEFPRSMFVPTPGEELAEPVFDRPRILEVAEVLPPPPALGGILIETPEQDTKERRPGFELPLQAPPMARRVCASAVDAILVLLGFSIFAYTFFWMTATIPPLRLTIGVSAGLMAAFWAAYQYLLLVCGGTTPGLKLAGLRLSRFDGAPVPRRLRRWRVLASVLSGMSLMLGYAWCFLDEDELCWHDRITRTYMAPK